MLDLLSLPAASWADSSLLKLDGGSLLAFIHQATILGIFEGEAQPEGMFGGFGNFGMILLMLAVFYFIVLRPMKGQEKQRKERLASLKKNDRIVLNNGIFGRISSLDDKIIMLEVADKVKIKVKRGEVADFEENALKDDADKKKGDADKKKDDEAKKKDDEAKKKDDEAKNKDDEAKKKDDEADDDEDGKAKS